MIPQRVVAYVTCDGQLLVFEAEGVEGLHVPAGRGDPGESLEQTLRRELAEETGVTDARIVRKLGSSTRDRDPYGVFESHYFHVETHEPRRAWDHLVSCEGDEDGLLFECRFVPLREAALAGDLGEFLHELP